MENDFSIKDYVKEESARKIFAKVFDKQTIETVHQLAVKGYFDLVEFVISTGKEAHVFRAIDKARNYKAVKIYKIGTSDFKHMTQYIEGDRRFKGLKKNKRDIVFAWAKKEYKNLQLFSDSKIRVPMPIAQMNNVLVMEFIGENGEAALTLKDDPIEDLEYLYETLVEYLAKMIYKAELVHSDLSQFNILNYNEQPVLIDCGQAVLTSHPKAKEFFERDLRNLSAYFSKMGLNKSFEGFYEDVKAKKSSFL